MELLYLWIEDDGINIKNQSFNFSNHVRFSFEKIGESAGRILLEENLNFIDGFFTELSGNINSGGVAEIRGCVANVTGVIGENGAGKTNLLNYIIKLLTDGLPFGTEYIVAFKDKRNKLIKVFHSLKDFEIKIDGKIVDYAIEKPIEQKISYGLFDNPRRDPSKLVENPNLIYYNPIFDLRDYPSNISNENKNYIDVSTNALIEYDVIRKGDRYPEDIKEIELHKYSNVRRQFEMLTNPGITQIEGINLPNEVKLIFHRDHFDPKKGKRNLSFENESIFNQFTTLTTEAWKDVSTKLDLSENKYSIGSRRSKSGKRNSIEYKKALAEKLKVEFTDSMIHNFFHNLSSEYEIGIGIKLDDIKGESLFDRASFFFNQQKWEGRGKFITVLAGPFYDLILHLINNVDLEKNPIEDDSNSFVTDVTGGTDAITNYENYILSIPSDFKKNFISTSWRSVSSGENALMDLYSRLFFAKQRLNEFRNNEDEEFKSFIYILIDEGEVGFHPQWQSEYLYNLLTFVNRLFAKYEVQIILTSHSPFLASDLPKENLIFLEKREGMSNVVSFKEEQTFAANIHRLLASQFFLKSGVIGKFAQTKLQQELQPLLEKSGVDLDDERLRKIIALIGEPVVKSKLTEILSSKGSK